MPIRVLIADDSDVMRAGIARTLKADPDLEVVGEAASFAETLERRNSNLKEPGLGVNWALLSMPEMDSWCRHRPGPSEP